VIRSCLKNKKNLVTASFNADLQHFDKLARNSKDPENGITILGEMGVDPGIDHMITM